MYSGPQFPPLYSEALNQSSEFSAMSGGAQDSAEEAKGPLGAGAGESLSGDVSRFHLGFHLSSCSWTCLNTVVLHEIVFGMRIQLLKQC